MCDLFSGFTQYGGVLKIFISTGNLWDVPKDDSTFINSLYVPVFKPSFIINYGTAGALNKKLKGLVKITSFCDRDSISVSKFIKTNTSESEEEMCSVSVRSSKFTSEQPSRTSKVSKMMVSLLII